MTDDAEAMRAMLEMLAHGEPVVSDGGDEPELADVATLLRIGLGPECVGLAVVAVFNVGDDRPVFGCEAGLSGEMDPMSLGRAVEACGRTLIEQETARRN